MNKLSALIQQLEAKIPHSHKLNTAISQSPVGWHIQHTLLVTEKIIQALERSDPNQYARKFNLSRSFVFTLNKIPRGKAKAPKSVMPTEPFEAATILDNLKALQSKIQALNTLDARQYFEHPYFGKLNVKATRKFLELHTKHHLAIIDDMIP